MHKLLVLLLVRLPTCDGDPPIEVDPDPDAGMGRFGDARPRDTPDAYQVPERPDAAPPAAPCSGEPPAFEEDVCTRLHPTEVPPELGCAPDGALRIGIRPEEDLPEAAGQVGFPFPAPRAIEIPFVVDARPDEAAHVRWHLEGSIPAGLWIDSCSGRLQGTLEWPAEDGLAVVAVVGEGEQCRFTRAPVAGGPASCTPEAPGADTVPAAVAGQPYSARLPYGHRVRWESGRLPMGLQLDCETARLVGTPEEAGEFTFEIRWLDEDCTGVVEVTLVVD